MAFLKDQYLNSSFCIIKERSHMLTKLHLINYKSYKDSEIEIKPITIFCGGNSSGKTSIIKSILLMKQSFEASGNNYLLINGPYTNNGLYDDLCRKSVDENTDEMSISASYSITPSNNSFRDICKSLGMSSRSNHFCSFQIDSSFKFKKNHDFPQIGEIKETSVKFTLHFSDQATNYTNQSRVSEIRIAQCLDQTHYTIDLFSFPIPLYSKSKEEYPFIFFDRSWDKCTCYFRGMQLVSLYKDSLSKKDTSALPILYTLFRVLSSELDKTKYIGPLRETPQRQYSLQDICSDIGVKGENTANFLGQFYNRSVDTFLPNCISKETTTLGNAVKEWATFLGIEKLTIDNSDIPGVKITQINIGDQNIVDVGFGISQVLPILVEGLSIHTGDTLILEQPEIHLHPKMQMEMTDFLISLAKQEKNLIVETHSDHVINRLVRRALEDSALKNIIQIYFIEKDFSNCSTLTKVDIDETLGIDNAPIGFFDQYASETNQILKSGYSNMKSRLRGNSYE